MQKCNYPVFICATPTQHHYAGVAQIDKLWIYPFPDLMLFILKMLWCINNAIDTSHFKQKITAHMDCYARFEAH
jgi:hypothetical protein